MRAHQDSRGVMGQSHKVRGFKRHRRVDVRLPGKGDSNSHGARPVHLVITIMKWIRTSRLAKKNSLTLSLFKKQLPYKKMQRIQDRQARI